MIVVRRTELDRTKLEKLTVNPEDIADDGTDYTNIRVNKPWGHEVEQYKDEKVAVWWLHIHTRQATSMHCHPHKTTMLFVVTGRGLLVTLNSVHAISEGDMAVIEEGAFHKTIAKDVALVLYELETPPNKRDLVRLSDDYGRGQGYERVGSA